MNPIKILAVEDKISNSPELEKYLSTINAQLIKSTSGQDANLILNEKSIDCVLLDLSLPQVDGFEFLKALRETPAHKNTPVILIAAEALSDNEYLMADELGVVDYLVKPFVPQTVFFKIKFYAQQVDRAKAIEQVESHLSRLEAEIINPLIRLAKDNAIADTTLQLNAVIHFLEELNADWKEVG